MAGLKYYLNIDGFNGGSTDPGHEGWFEIDSYEFDILNPASDTAGSGKGKPIFSPLAITLGSAIDSKLLKILATGKPFKAIQLDGVTVGATPQTVYSLTLANVLLNSYQDDAGATGDRLTFDYTQVSVTTRSQKPDGSLATPQSFGWDVLKNSAIANPSSVPKPANPPASTGVVKPTKYYLNIPGLNGGSTAPGHEGWFEIDNYDFTIQNPSSLPSGGGAGKPTFSPLNIFLNSALAPQLLLDLASGQHFTGIQLDGVTVGATEQTVYSLALVDVILSDYKDVTGVANDVLTFDYAQVIVSTSTQKPDGSLNPPQIFGWDVATNSESLAPSIPNIANPPVSGSIVNPTKFYLNIDGLNGGSTAVGHEGWFEIDGYKFDILNQASVSSGTSGSGTGKATFSLLEIALGGASDPKLLQALAAGRTFRAVQLDGVTVGATEQTVYSLNLANVLVNSYQDVADSAGDRLTLDYTQVAVTTRSQKPDGSLDAPQSSGWDVTLNRAIANPSSVTKPANPPASGSGAQPTKYYLNIDGINGGSTAVGHEGWFEIDDYKFEIQNPSSLATGVGTDKSVFSPLEIILDSAISPQLLLNLANGRTFRAIQLDGVTSGATEQTVYSLTLAEASLANYKDVTGDLSDRLSFNYGRVAVTTRSQKPDGSLNLPQSFGWDVTLNSALANPSSIPKPANPPATGSIVNPTKYYLNIDGLNGGSTAIGHEGWFEIDSYDFEIQNPSSASGSGKATFSLLEIALGGALDPKLLQALAAGKPFKAIQLDGVTGGATEQTVYSLNLANVLVNSYRDGAGATGDRLTFDYTQVAITTRSQKPDGSLNAPQSSGWDVSKNSALANPSSVPKPANPQASQSAAQPTKYYLNIDGLKGNSTAVGHEGWFEIDDYKFEIQNPSSIATGVVAGKPIFSPLEIILGGTLDPNLLKDLATVKRFKAIQLDGVTIGATEQTVYSVQLADVLLTNYTDVAASTGDRLTFDYKNVAVTTRSPQPDGSLIPLQSFGWNVTSESEIVPNSVPTPLNPNIALPTLGISDVFRSEGNTGITNFDFTLALSAPSSRTISVTYTTADDTATAASDYLAASGTIVFAPGETSKIVSIQVNGDTVVEATETFKLLLNDALNVEIVQNTATGTIVNDDLNVVSGTPTADRLVGTEFDDIIAAGAGNDTIFAGVGDDIISGGVGVDLLSGGAGRDLFRFNAANEGFDKINDFEVEFDRISISRSGFGGDRVFGSDSSIGGALDPSRLTIGTVATSASHRFIYNDRSGILFFDVDGVGGNAQVRIAQLVGIPTLTDFSFSMF